MIAGDMTPYLYQCVSLKPWTRLMVLSIDSCGRCGGLSKRFLKHRYDLSLVLSQQQSSFDSVHFLEISFFFFTDRYRMGKCVRYITCSYWETKTCRDWDIYTINNGPVIETGMNSVGTHFLYQWRAFYRDRHEQRRHPFPFHGMRSRLLLSNNAWLLRWKIPL